jgi:hypothetical protein
LLGISDICDLSFGSIMQLIETLCLIAAAGHDGLHQGVAGEAGCEDCVLTGQQQRQHYSSTHKGLMLHPPHSGRTARAGSSGRHASTVQDGRQHAQQQEVLQSAHCSNSAAQVFLFASH